MKKTAPSATVCMRTVASLKGLANFAQFTPGLTPRAQYYFVPAGSILRNRSTVPNKTSSQAPAGRLAVPASSLTQT